VPGTEGAKAPGADGVSDERKTFMSDETDYPNVRKGLDERKVPKLQQELLLELMREADAAKDRHRAICELVFPKVKK